MKASDIGIKPTARRRTVDTSRADQRLAEIRQEEAERDAANKADHAKRVARIEAERIAYNEEQQAKRDAVELERLTASLRGTYLLQPGATEAEFQKALPGLIEERRQQDAKTQAEGARQFSKMRVGRLI
jgi:hypothetical protein